MPTPSRILTRYLTDGLEVGCDEAGRGCLAGPVAAAAVCLPNGFHDPAVRDSKQLTPKQREKARLLVEREAIAWRVEMVLPEQIDQLNILQASLHAMRRAVTALPIQPDIILVDGNAFLPIHGVAHRCVIHGDSIYASIAAASILAKTHRDELMRALHLQFPAYGWDKNKGYPTRAHRDAIAAHGPSPHHRRSFRLLPS